ncbi:hypothetical protein GOP47_0021580 [Adiantum capillus-veneris]|uniref:Secreted protein n=1 Tax=Adiantum capillus-veneris TaxID=13818 RepID=A0A9D4U8N8_ADICA|nr:hypothetical protein GOP47_0021580 [Adiantum capillus-veneris]
MVGFLLSSRFVVVNWLPSCSTSVPPLHGKAVTLLASSRHCAPSIIDEQPFIWPFFYFSFGNVQSTGPQVNPLRFSPMRLVVKLAFFPV